MIVTKVSVFKVDNKGRFYVKRVMQRYDKMVGF